MGKRNKFDLNKLSIGLEFGSTRIKAVVIDEKGTIVCLSEYGWENEFINGVWSYSMSNIVKGLQDCFSHLLENFKNQYNQVLSTCGAMGVSGMMHGYLVFDKTGHLLAPFRTWRNTLTEKAADILSNLFNFAIPQRWSIAHIYQSILDNSPEVNNIDFATTLAGYIHYRLTGQKVIGIGEGSGMFPVDLKTNAFDEEMIQKFNELVKDRIDWKIENILPKNLLAGENAGYLTKEGAKFLDPTGTFLPGVPLVPPEGDMGTGMVATNSISINTGNASIGTSSNLTIITGKYLKPSKELDTIVTPAGLPAILIHVNNGTYDINQWVNMIHEAIILSGGNISKGDLFSKLFNLALSGDGDCGGCLSFNTASGEPILHINEGRPILIRTPDANMSLANLMRSILNGVFFVLRLGLDKLKEQDVSVNQITGHGGFFKTPVVGSKFMSAALNCKSLTMSSSGEGGPYGMALLASYYLFKEKNETLEDYLSNKIFTNIETEMIEATESEKEAFNKCYNVYKNALKVEEVCIQCIKI